MASNMTKAFQTKSRRALGCRPGYAVGGTTDVFKTGSNSFSDMPGAGGQLMAQPMGGVGSPGLPTSAPTSALTSPVSPGGGQSLGQGALGVPGENSYISRGPMKADGANSVGAYSDTPQGRIAADRDRMLQNGMSASTYQQFHSPDARMQQDAAAKVQNTLSSASSRDLDMLAGHNPTGMYSYNAGGNKVYANETADSRAQMRAQGMSSLGLAPGQTTPGAAPEMQAALKKQAGIQLGAQSTAALWGYADGGAVVKPQEDPAEAVLRRMQQNYGVAAPAPRPQAPAPAPTPAPAPQPERRTLGDIVRQRADELKRVTNYADGGTVRQVEFQGPGGPREDKIPVRFAGADIRVSDGERGVILPAKTAANPNAVDAIEDIIQSTNDGRSPRRALGDGGHYADSGISSTALHPDVLKNAVSNAAAGPGNAPNPWAAPQQAVVAPEPEVPITPKTRIVEPTIIGQQPAAPAEPPQGATRRAVNAVKERAVRALGGTPAEPAAAVAVQPAAAPTAATAVPEAENLSRLGRIRAGLNGKSTTDIGDVGRKLYQGVKKVAPSPGGAVSGIAVGAGLEGAVRGLNTDTSEYAQRMGVDEPNSVLGATALRTAGVASDIGASAINAAALPYNVIKNGIDTKAAGEAWDKAQNHYGYEKPLAALGGATKDWWDYRNHYDDVKAAHAEAGPAPTPLTATQIAQARGNMQQGYGNEGRYSDLDRLSQADSQRQRALGASTGNAGNVSVEKDGNMIRFQASKGYNPTAEKFAPGTGVMTVTGEAEGGGRMMPGIKQHALGTSFAVGPGDYLAKDGSRTSDWSKTADYEGGLRRAEQNRVALAQIQNERAGRDPMASRALGQQMLPPGEDAATDTSSQAALLQSATKNLASSNSGTRALGQQYMAAYDHLARQALALSNAQWARSKDMTEMGNADRAQARADAEAFDKHLGTVLRNPKGGKDGNEDVPDTEAIAEFKRMAAYTAAANLKEAKTPEQKARWTSKFTNKARDAAELDAADHAQMLQQFRVRQRHLATMGNLWGDPDVGDSQRLDHWTPHITKDGEMVYFPKMTKGGKPISGKVKQYAFTRPITASRFQALETPTNDILADAIRDQ